MGLPVTISLEVPDLPDASVWFANAAAWKNYWRNLNADATIEGASTSIYTPVPYDNTLVPCYTVMDGVNYVLITLDMFQSIQARYDALEASYQDLRTQLKDAGLIDNAQ